MFFAHRVHRGQVVLVVLAFFVGMPPASPTEEEPPLRLQYYSANPLAPTYLTCDEELVLRCVDVRCAGGANWTLPTTCQLVDTVSTQEVHIVCTATTTTANVTVQVEANGALGEIFLALQPALESFEWYSVFVVDGVVTNLVSPHHSAELRVWVIHPAEASDEEMNATALVPSTPSRLVTQLFARMGDAPVPTIPISGLSDSGLLTSLGFQVDSSLWQFSFQPKGYPVPLELASRGILVGGHTIRERPHTLWVAMFAEPPLGTSQTQAPDPPASLQLVSEPRCSATIFALASSNSFYYTQTSFYQTNVVHVDEATFGTLRALAVTTCGVAALTSTGIFCTRATTESESSQEPFASTGLPSPFTLDRIQGPPVFDVFSEITSWNHFLAAWNSNPGLSEHDVYVSNDYGTSFSALRIADDLFPTSSCRLAAFCPILGYDGYLALVVQDDRERLVHLSDSGAILAWGATFTGENRLLSGTKAPEVHITHSKLGSEVFLFGDTLYFSPDGGLSAMRVYLRPMTADTTTDESLSTCCDLSGSDYIDSVVTDVEGAFAVMTATRRLFYGRVGLLYAVELSSGLPVSGAAAMQFDLHSRLSIYTPAPAGTNARDAIISRIVPTSNELKRSSSLLCPHVRWLCDLSYMYSLDMGDSLTFTSTLIPRSLNDDTRISVTVSNSSKLTFATENTRWTVFGDVVSQEVSIRVFETPRSYPSRDERIRDATGDVNIRCTPHAVNVMCDVAHIMSRVYVGCPSNRHIRVRDRHTDCSGHYDYDVDVWGCPASVYWGTEGYRPIVDLYDGDTFVRELTAEFVLWEVGGRRGDFTYNISECNAGCVSKSLRWDDAIARNQSDPYAAWTPSDHRSCFDADGPAQDKCYAYEVLGGPGNSGIVFKINGDGLFFFRLRVVDPECSYCDLETRFVLNVFGAPVDPLLALFVCGVVLLVAFVMFATAYLIFRRKQKVT